MIMRVKTGAGPARAAVQACFLQCTETAFSKAMDVLKSRFGSQFAMAEPFAFKLDSWPKICMHNNGGTQHYGDFLAQCLVAMEQIEDLYISNDLKQLAATGSKLPEWLSSRSKRVLVGLRRVNGTQPKFRECEFCAR